MRIIRTMRSMIASAALLVCTATLVWADPALVMTLGRNVVQTDETYRMAVVREAEELLEAGEMSVKLHGPGQSLYHAVFDVPGGQKKRTEYVNFDIKMLAPGEYEIEVDVDGLTLKTPMTVYSHLRESSFKLINWSRRQAKYNPEMIHRQAEEYGYNMMMWSLLPSATKDLIIGGLDLISACVQGGGHQPNLRNDCDWSDPYAINGPRRQAAMWTQTHEASPVLHGVHFFDEPGLTWMKHEETGEFTPHGIPAQVRSFESAFGESPIQYHEVDPDNPEDVARWKHWARWKLGFMPAAWKYSAQATDVIDPSLLSLTQSQYGWNAFTDGYYFNVQRNLPVTMGHGGYHHLLLGYWRPSFTFEIARARDDNPMWYMPLWFNQSGSIEGLVRLEQYLSFQTGLQGMMTPPPLNPMEHKNAQEEIKETNELLGRLGTIFTTLDPKPADVGILYSLSHTVNVQVHDMNHKYAQDEQHIISNFFAYLAMKLMQIDADFVLEEDILDGSVAADQKVLLVMSVDVVAPGVKEALERFIAGGGTVVITPDSELELAGATVLKAMPELPDQAKHDELNERKNSGEGNPKELGEAIGALSRVRQFLQGSLEFMQELKPVMTKAGIKPVVVSSEHGLSATSHIDGDVEYIFLVNAAHDFESDDMQLGIKPMTVQVSIPNDGRPVYELTAEDDKSPFAAKGDMLTAELEFDKGGIRIFARTTRSLGDIQVATPRVHTSLLDLESPIDVRISAVFLDDQGGLLDLVAPLKITLTDPAGRVRHELYRASDEGVFKMTLPLAANDPAGQWTVTVQELINGSSNSAEFTYTPMKENGALAGLTERALFFGNDRERVFEFFRTFENVTVVKGDDPTHAAAAERIVEILKPWLIEVNVVDAEAVNKPRPISEEAAPTWSGPGHTKRGAIKPGTQNDIFEVGYDLPGPVILLGNPQNNPLIAALTPPRRPMAIRGLGSTVAMALNDDLPGPGRGLVTWQIEVLGPGSESIALIANDEAGLNQAIGSMYEAAAGMEPLTRWVMPKRILPSFPNLNPAVENRE